MNKKIIISLSIIVAVGAIVIGATTSYFSNTETSAGNTFIAGAIDLKVDNTCHLNGRVCEGSPTGGYFWHGTTEPCTCTWGLSDLDGKAIFNFTDVKPGDDGEDTISLHVDTNPAWVCAEISNVTSAENGCNAPEAKVDTTCASSSGELWDELRFDIWMDDNCDNIWQQGELVLIEGAGASNIKWPIADSKTGGEPIEDACIGVAWSVPDEVGNVIQGDSVTGDITFSAYQARHNDSFLCNPPVLTCGDGIVTPPGETCELPNTTDNTYCGQSTTQCVDYKLQTRDALGNCNGICGCVYDEWSAPVCNMQTCGAGCESDANCDDHNPATTDTCNLESCGCQHSNIGTLTVNKVLVPSSDPGLFNLQIDSVTKAVNVGNGGTTGAIVGNGTFTVGETGGTATNLGDYTTVIGGDCASNGSVTVNEGDTKVCTITNTRIAHLTINKVLVPNTDPGKFNLRLNGVIRAADVGDGGTTGVINVSPGGHTVSETAGTATNLSDYTTVIGGDCPSNGSIVISTGDQKVCTITNTRMGTITVTKQVTNDDGGLLTVGSFTLKIDGITVTSGVAKNVAVGAHDVSEVGVFGYSATFSGDCDSSGHVTVAAGETKSCTITNDDIAPSIRLIKTVVGGSADPDDFDVSIDHAIKTSGSSNPVMANTAHVIDEEATVSGYSFTSPITGISYLGVSCPAALEGTITLLPGDVVTCTITNTKP